MSDEPVCRICRTPAAVWERNQDGSYTHVACASDEANRHGFRLLPPKETRDARTPSDDRG